ncbi:hypothetical protein [Paraburkholderia sp.]|uniref:hypothetical protein n=1 Tax=Paraburkholderia sp. TaxID=1926495 RepID=UPI0025E9B007|nr:hypothetical protein [Paraburkholderia sp.]
MLITSGFEITYVLIAFALLGAILIGALITALHLERWHPRLIGAAIGTLLGFVLIEALPMMT